MERSELDHIVIAARTLREGAAWVEDRLGVAPLAGGQHVAMGTHNALLKLGPRCYLEVIAIDPALEAPARPRWFSLDEPAMQERLAQSPALITWVVRASSLANACARVPDLGEITPMSRGDFRWQITVPDSGTLPWGGILPTAIQWEADETGSVLHPCDRLPESGCEWAALKLAHPLAVLGTSGIVGLFRELKITGPVDLKPGPKSLEAVIRTARGDVVLS
jgi:hypothetical protein